MIDLSKYTDRLTDKDFLKVELDNGIRLDNPQFMDLARNTISQLNGYGSTVIDYGFEVEVIEKFKAHRDYLKINLPEIKITRKLKDVDIMLFIEVAEHMTDNEIAALFEQGQPKWILFSSTPQVTSWDEQWGHINVKQANEWDKFFLTLGYRKHKDLAIPTEWAKMYERI